MQHVAYHSDDAHGWLAVPLDSCEGLPVSEYSFIGEAFWTDTQPPVGFAPGERVAYLEEDVDARLWTERERAGGRPFVVSHVVHDGRAFVRELDRFPASESFSVALVDGSAV